MRILFNLLILVGEIAAIIAVGFLAYSYPLLFAALTFLLVLGIGAKLEYGRLMHEIPYYLSGTTSTTRRVFVGLISTVTTLAKATAIAIVALMTFSGTDTTRMMILAVIFCVCMFAGTSLLRRLAMSLNVYPARWGYFRLALPLGILFAAGLALATRLGLVTTPSAGEITRKLIIDTPARPSISQASELLFQLKQYIDTVLHTLLQTLIPIEAAEFLSVVVSANVLVGMVLAVFVVVIAEAVRFCELTNETGSK